MHLIENTCTWTPFKCIHVHVRRYLKTTAANIQLINQFKKRETGDEEKPMESLFIFWMEFFIEATKDDFTTTRFPVSTYMRMYIHVLYIMFCLWAR